MDSSHKPRNVAVSGWRDPAESRPVPPDVDALLQVLPVGVFTIDADKCVTAINPAACQITGVSVEAALGRNCSELLQCSYCGPSCASCVTRATGDIARDFPVTLRHGDNGERSVMIDSAPLGGGSVAVIVRDAPETQRVRQALSDRWIFHGLVCASPIMKDIVSRVRDVAPYESTVLILGESGTGKEMVARAIHAESPRRNRPFVTINCSAYSENLLESELFGHVRGSYTGANADRRGRFEMANGGTIFLDEIGEISAQVQVKLLRVLQEREIERVGDSKSRPVDLRIIAATNRDLRREVQTGRFREDLFYRLDVFTVQLPPLRDRTGDVVALTGFLLDKVATRIGKPVRSVSDQAIEILAQHTWPGNVRELENVLESAVVRARGDVLTPADLPRSFGLSPTSSESREEGVREALRRTAGCVTRAAGLLGMHRTTLWRYMRENGLSREEFLLG